MTDFYIKEGATLPVLVMKVNRDNQFAYENFQNALENCSITFSMSDIETGTLKIAKKEGGLILKESGDTVSTLNKEYYIYYKFTEKDTNKVGRYKGEFKIDFFDLTESPMTGTFIAPIYNEIYINVVKSLFKDSNLNNKNISNTFNSAFTIEFS
jgi:hypothetical protein